MAVQRALAARNVPFLQLVRNTPAWNRQLRWDPAGSPPFPDSGVLEGLGAAIHLAGASLAGHRWTPAYKRDLWASRVQSTRALAETFASLRNPPRVLLIASAVGVYGDRGNEILDESSSPGTGFLADLCKEWEAAARPAVDAGIRVVHSRFGVVLEPRSGALGKMLPLFRFGLGGPLGSGRQYMSWASIEDAVAAILFAMDSPSLSGPINVCAPAPVTNREFSRALGRVLHRPALLPAPAFALRLALGEMADEALLASTRAVPGRLMENGFQFARPTIEEALAHAVASRQ